MLIRTQRNMYASMMYELLDSALLPGTLSPSPGTPNLHFDQLGQCVTHN